VDYVAAGALGFAGGAVGGMLGVGGGVLFVPALTIFLGEPQIEAEATSLAVIVPMALVGAWRQSGFGNLHVGDAIWIGGLSPLGAVAGVVIANSVSQRTLELSFAALLLVIATQLAYRALARGDAEGT
jgi:uncharacterized membrane protein YfcA